MSLSFSTFSSASFSPEATTDKLFATTTRDEVANSVVPSLQSLTRHASSSLVANLYDNHSTFIAISLHIDELTAASAALASSLSSLSHALDSLATSFPALSDAALPARPTGGAVSLSAAASALLQRWESLTRHALVCASASVCPQAHK